MSENLGAYQVDYVTADVTSLTNAGSEPIATWLDQSEIDNIDGAAIVGQENGGYLFSYDHLNEAVHAKYADYDATADGALIDVPSGTDVGEVVVRLEGRT